MIPPYTRAGGTFVIAWAQTVVDGLANAPLSSVHEGAAWSWKGEALRLDTPGLNIPPPDGRDVSRLGAARMARRLVGAALQGDATHLSETDGDDPAAPSDNLFVVTDGLHSWILTLIGTGTGRQPLLMVQGAMPPVGRDLWVTEVSSTLPLSPEPGEASSGIICFTPGTRIATGDGPVPVEKLTPGDRVQTKDNGLQPVVWTGARRMSGARLFAMPHLRPIRLRGGVLGGDVPDGDTLVSPGHRMLLRGPQAQALFNTPEVLVCARDLVDGRGVTRDSQLREVTYCHLAFERHEVIFANGIETESFHPADMALASLSEADRTRLCDALPGIADNPARFGAHARRSLSRPEAVLLLHAAA